MSIRIKTFLVISLTFLVMLGMLNFTAEWFLLRDANVTEQKSTTRDVTRLVEVLDNQIKVMDSIVSDWAPWDDTYAFIRGADNGYIDANLTNVVFANLEVELMLFINNSGQIVFGKMVDLASGEEMPIPEGLSKQLQVDSRLLSHNDPSKKMAGILALPEGPMIIASQPILTSLGEGPTGGTLIIGRRLDKAEIGRLSQMTQLSINIFPYNDAVLPEQVTLARNSLTGLKPIFTAPQSETVVSGYTLINDIYGKPALILQVDDPREVIAQARMSMRYMGLALLAIGIGLGLVTMFLLERMVVIRLTGLNSSVMKIGSQGATFSRVEAKGKDEIFTLATSVNSMLDSLENSRAKERESENRFRAIFEQAAVGVAQINSRTGEYVRVNQKYCVILGYSGEELLRMRFQEISHPDDQPGDLEQMQKLLAGEIRSFAMEKRHFHSDGSILWLSLTVSPMWAPGEAPDYHIAIVEDISARKLAENALTKTEQIYRQAITRTGGVPYQLDYASESYAFLGEGFESLTGYLPAEMTGPLFTSRLRQVESFGEHKDLSHEQRIQMARQGEVSEWREDYLFERKDGRLIWLADHSVQINGTVGNPIGSLGILIDITERKHADQALSQSEAELRALFASMHDVVLVIDHAGVYCKIAPTNPGLLVKPPEELLGKTLQEVFPPEQAENLLKVVQQVLVTKQTAQIEYDLLIDDKPLRFETSISPMTEDSTLWVAHNITERKRFELIQDAIYRITQATITCEGIEALYQSIHSILGELIPAENFFIALYDPATELISFPYYVDQYDEPPALQTKVQGLTGYVIRTGSPLLATREIYNRLVQQDEVEVVGTPGGDWMGAPLKVAGRMIGVMAVQSYSQGIHFKQEDLNLMEFVSSQVAQVIERKGMEAQIVSLSLTDELTGLYNRRGFTHLAEQELKLARRFKRCVYLFFGDLDHLKTINDTHGHVQGDLALKETADILRETFREADIPARFGGDEFVVLAVDVAMVSADTLTNRLQDALKRRNQREGQLYQLGLSLGVACYDPEADCSLKELIALADSRMYSRKKAGMGEGSDSPHLKTSG